MGTPSQEGGNCKNHGIFGQQGEVGTRAEVVDKIQRRKMTWPTNLSTMPYSFFHSCTQH